MNCICSELLLNNRIIKHDVIAFVKKNYLHKRLICTALLRSDSRPSSVAVHEYLLYLCPLVTFNLIISSISPFILVWLIYHVQDKVRNLQYESGVEVDLLIHVSFKQVSISVVRFPLISGFSGLAQKSKTLHYLII